jgi:hypothetical protein
MVIHEAVGVADPVHPLDRGFEQFQEQLSVVIIPIDVLLMVTTVVDVIDGPKEFEAGFS